MSEWLLEYEARPFTMNQVYGRWNRHQRNEANQEWRQAFALLAKEQKIPALDRIQVVAWPIHRDRRWQDVGACFPAVKAAIDGLVDAGVIPEDDPRFLSAISMGEPKLSAGRDALAVLVVHDPYDA